MGYALVWRKCYDCGIALLLQVARVYYVNYFLCWHDHCDSTIWCYCPCIRGDSLHLKSWFLFFVTTDYAQEFVIYTQIHAPVTLTSQIDKHR